MNVNAKQTADRQRDMAIQQEQELSRDIKKCMQIIQEVSLHEQACKELERLRHLEILYNEKKKRALERRRQRIDRQELTGRKTDIWRENFYKNKNN